jgi:phosphoribosylformylglycinamidine cyclo-ligase
MDEPVLVSGTDGVGTKLLIAQRAEQHQSIGIDLVAMCANDVLTVGAEPLFFLDYLATGQLDPEVGLQIVDGVATGCEQAGCALMGGETAEMPGMYPGGKYDLAGFCVGVVDKKDILDGSRVAPGDVILGLPSNGLHSNGFSLVRHVLFEHHDFALTDRPEPLAQSLADELLRPTRIYAKAVLPIVRNFNVHALAHITGGGLAGNLLRVIPNGCKARLNRSAWHEGEIFTLLRKLGIPNQEMDATFNLGLGMLIVAPESDAKAIQAHLAALGEPCAEVGRVEAGDHEVQVTGAPQP